MHGGGKMATMPPEIRGEVSDGTGGAAVAGANTGAGAGIYAPMPSASDLPPVVIFDRATKKFGKDEVLRGLTFTVPQGRVLGVIGPSGSGKSTMVRLMLGMYRPTDGLVTLFGKEPWKLRRTDRERIGYMPQDFVLYPTLTAEETLHFAASLYGVPPRRAHERARELLKFVELDDARKRRADDLSGGMRRRLSLAATLVHDPDFLILDEPTAGIDPILRVSIWDGLKQARDGGKTLVVTTQYVTEAEYCDAVLLVYEGAIIAAGTPDELRRSATGGDMLDVRLNGAIEPHTADRLRQLDFVTHVEGRERPDEIRVTVNSVQEDLPMLTAFFDLEAGGHAEVQPYVPSFEDVFIRLVTQAREAPGGTINGHGGDAAR